MTEVADNTLVDGRYRILNRIGSGGMADVYCAEDTHLGRQIALKVLYRRFAQDSEFVERFRREASSAASLQHPCIVNVYDRGEHEGTYYIAMELLAGRTLKQLVGEDAPLTQERAIDLAIQVLQGAGFAHRRGVVHRDFKPHNVIVADDDSVKVTDFGIARMGTSEMTETGSIMGTAQYLSPEQAQGQEVGPASDIYSIGVIVYELLAGRPPFESDTAVAVALRHINDAPPPLRELRPDVHPALDGAVMRALAKDPGERYPTAEDFIASLAEARDKLGGAPSAEDTAAYAAFAAAAEAAPDTGDQVAAGAVVGDYPPPDGEPEDEERKRWPYFALGLVLLGLIAAVLWATVFQPTQVRVPKVVGQQAATAQTALDRAGFEVKSRRVTDNVAPVGQVIAQDPAAGNKADEGSTIELTVSSGPGEGRVPSVEGLSSERAIKELNDAGFKKVTTDPEASDSVKKGFVTRTVPAGGVEASKSDRIRLFVSSGVARVKVPEVVGVTRSSAESRLEADGLVAVVEERADDRPADQVIGQDPAAGTSVSKGTRVTVTVSQGPVRTSVPDVTRLTEGNARGELRDAGFGIQVKEEATADESEDGIVLRQNPAGGTQLRKGRTIVVTVGAFEPAPEEPVAPPVTP